MTHVSSPNALTPKQRQFIQKVVRDNMHVEYEGDPVALRKKGFTVFTAERPHDADTILSPVLVDTSVFFRRFIFLCRYFGNCTQQKIRKANGMFFHIPRYRFFRKNDADVLRDASNILSSLGSESVEESVRVPVAIAYMRENETSQLGQNVYYDTHTNEALVVQYNPHARAMEE